MKNNKNAIEVKKCEGVTLKYGGAISGLNGIDLIKEILTMVQNFRSPDSRIIYRGVSKDHSPGFIRSGAAVRLDPGMKWSYSYSEYMAYIRELITDVQKNYPENYSNWHELDILGDLQHNGAGTCLVDFSRNLLISLWFACAETKESKKETEGISPKKEGDAGVLFCYDVNDDLIKRNNLKIIKDTDLELPIEELLLETKQVTNFCSDAGYSFFMWTPSNINNRIARQDSVFIFGLPRFVLEEHSILAITIPAQFKSPIREALEMYFDVSDTSIFNDKHGFATVNDKLRTYSQNTDKYMQGLNEMLKGNYKTALDFFIMYENTEESVHQGNNDPNVCVNVAELHLSKAICYKNRNNVEKDKKNCYGDNAIREYKEARTNYKKALEEVSKTDELSSPWVTLCARKLLRTSNDELQLLYHQKEYYRCIKSCDEAIENINFLQSIGITSFSHVYCQISKLELLLLVIISDRGNDMHNTDWTKYVADAEGNLNKSDFDKMLVAFFKVVWAGIQKYDDKIFEDIILDFNTNIEKQFAKTNDGHNKVPYSSWDFTEIRDAIAEATFIPDNTKVQLQDATAHIISIRDRYNVKELNSNEMS